MRLSSISTCADLMTVQNSTAKGTEAMPEQEVSWPRPVLLES